MRSKNKINQCKTHLLKNLLHNRTKRSVNYTNKDTLWSKMFLFLHYSGLLKDFVSTHTTLITIS